MVWGNPKPHLVTYWLLARPQRRAAARELLWTCWAAERYKARGDDPYAQIGAAGRTLRVHTVLVPEYLGYAYFLQAFTP